jgi:two-component system sensor histidine kinase RegB
MRARAARLTQPIRRALRHVGVSPIDLTGRKNMLQLINLRWMAVIGQLVTIAAVEGLFGIRLPLVGMGFVLSLVVSVNIVSLLRLRLNRDVANGELLLAMVLDVAALTAQLYFSGGATNPFISLFLLQVALSAVLLEAWSTWALAAMTTACFAGLTVLYLPLDLPARKSSQLFNLHLQGALVCYLLDAVLLAVFIARISANLRARDGRLADLRQQAAEEDHIVRMGLLASGAAHELGTPLSTLSVILGDWRRMPRFAKNPEMSQEIEDMQAEVERCKRILTGVLMSAGEARGEAPIVTTVKGFLGELIADWRATRAGPLDYDNRFGEDLQIVSDSALKQVICNVLDNALEVSPHWIGLSVARRDDALVLTVLDDGPGFDPERLAHFGKPYNSSKGRPGGGLGLFLVVNVARKLGGAVTAQNRPRAGAAVTLVLPLSALVYERSDAG